MGRAACSAQSLERAICHLSCSLDLHLVLSLERACALLIEVKGLGAMSGTILLTPNERRVAEDRPDCYWLYVVTDCDNVPRLQEPIRDPARLDWHEVMKVAHYYLAVDAMRQPMEVHDPEGATYGGKP